MQYRPENNACLHFKVEWKHNHLYVFIWHSEIRIVETSTQHNQLVWQSWQNKVEKEEKNSRYRRAIAFHIMASIYCKKLYMIHGLWLENKYKSNVCICGKDFNFDVSENVHYIKTL